MKKLLLLALAMHCSLALASKPLLSIVAQGPLPTVASAAKPAMAFYTVTNNASYTLEGLGLNHVPTGKTPLTVTQETSSLNTPPTCAEPFTLTPGQSCTLALTIVGDAVGGPEVCFTGQIPSRCSLPAKGEQLNVGDFMGRAYVVNFDPSPPPKSTVTVCDMNSLTGVFYNCVDAGITLDVGYDFAVAKFGASAYAYFSGAHTVPTRCDFSDEGVFSNCQLVPNTPPVLPDSTFGVATDTSDQTYVYLGTSDANTLIYQCPVISSSGDLSGCDDSGANSSLFPDGAGFMTFQTFNNTKYLYIGNPDITHGNGGIVQCKVLSDGSLSNCTNYPIPYAYAVGFATVNGSDYAYVTQIVQPGIPDPVFPGLVNKCHVSSSTGALSACAPMHPSYPSGNIIEPLDIVMKRVNGVLYAYVVDGGQLGTQTVWQCEVDSVTGDINSCAEPGVGDVFSFPFGLSIF